MFFFFFFIKKVQFDQLIEMMDNKTNTTRSLKRRRKSSVRALSHILVYGKNGYKLYFEKSHSFIVIWHMTNIFFFLSFSLFHIHICIFFFIKILFWFVYFETCLVLIHVFLMNFNFSSYC